MTLNIYYQAKLKAFTDLPSPEKTKRRQPKKKNSACRRRKRKDCGEQFKPLGPIVAI